MRSWRLVRLSRMTTALMTMTVITAAATLAAGPACAQKIAVIAAPGAAPLTRAQVAKIYLGRSFERRPVDLPEADPLRAAFYRNAADSDLSQVRAAWARVMFTGRGEPPRELPSAAAVKKAVAADPQAIGYVDASAVDDTVRAVLVLP